VRILTLDDLDTKGKTVFLRVDMNSPMDPKTMQILETSRIRESTESLKDLEGSKVVIASHQGRVGNKDYTGMENHAKVIFVAYSSTKITPEWKTTPKFFHKF